MNRKGEHNEYEEKAEPKSSAYMWELSAIPPHVRNISLDYGITKLALGEEHCIFLTANGCLYSSGGNTLGQLGLGDFRSRSEPCVVPFFKENNGAVKEIACGSYHSVVISESGELFSWGDNTKGQCAAGMKSILCQPYSIDIFDGKTGGNENSDKPLFQQVSCGNGHTLALSNDYDVWVWGSGSQVGLGSESCKTTIPRKVPAFEGKKVISVVCGERHSMALVQGDGLECESDLSEMKTAQNLNQESCASDLSTEESKDNQMRQSPISPRTYLNYENSDNLVTSGKEDQVSGLSNSEPVVMAKFEGTDEPPTATEGGGAEQTPSSLTGPHKEAEVNTTQSSCISHTRTESFDSGSSTDDGCTTSSKLWTSLGSINTEAKKKTDITISKLTNSVMSSVTGMFSSLPSAKVPQISSVHDKCKYCNGVVCDGRSVHCSVGLVTHVWTWGQGADGRLGHGDSFDRCEPFCIKSLSGVGVLRLVAGASHSLALTKYSQVFAWGENSHGQLGSKKEIVPKPRKIKCLSDVLVWDIAAGKYCSLFIGDGALGQPDVYICGHLPSGLALGESSGLQESQSLSSINIIQNDSESCTSPTSPRTCTSLTDNARHGTGKVARLVLFRKVGLLRSVAACGDQCAVLAVRDDSAHLDVINEIASTERVFYYQLSLIWQALFQPFLHSELWPHMKYRQSGDTLGCLIKSYYELLNCVASGLTQLTYCVQNMKKCEELFTLFLADGFRDVYNRYSMAFSDAVTVGSFESFPKHSSEFFLQCKPVLDELLDPSNADCANLNQAMRTVLKLPLDRMQHYGALINKLAFTLPPASARRAQLYEIITKWESLVTTDGNRQVDAYVTKAFWDTCPYKTLETFKEPWRRIIRNSKMNNLYHAKATRFSNHWFLLFNDLFVHVQSNKNCQSYALATLWADPLLSFDNEHLLYTIKITVPENTLLVCGPSATDRAEWLLAINRAVAKVISDTTTYRNVTEGINTKSGSLLTAVAREAQYTFTQEGRYRGATYRGMWLSGKCHGHGQMSWPDGQKYSGEFKHGMECGEGVMIWPLSSPEPQERYEGQWQDGNICGYGVMRYKDGDLYDGHWKDSMRHGHGMLKSGSYMSASPSIHIGEWVNDKRCGYGVMDDILRGEKYLGMWDDNMRCGSGLIVTLDGIYNEGKFLQNKLVGHGLLLCDDETSFEGEFIGDAQLSGKGVLSMANGDTLEGTFSGRWGEDIRVNGIFQKAPMLDFSSSSVDHFQTSSIADPRSKNSVSADKKWNSLFDECRASLGCHGDKDPDPVVCWKLLNKILASGHVHGLHEKYQQEVISELLGSKLCLTDSVHYSKDLATMQSYLSKAFDIPCHPLGRLVGGLVDAYRATYVGMGAHRRLLPHAVEEAKSYVHRIFSVLRILFPDLPNEDYVMLSEASVSGVDNTPVTENTINSSTLLHPVLFPRLYPPLFTLYALHHERMDCVYWERVILLNKRTDIALMNYLGIKRPFWLMKEEETNTSKQEGHDVKEVPPYFQAIESLQHISTKFSPMEKLEVLKQTFEKINEEVEKCWQGEVKLVSLDDVFPVFQFVVYRSRIHHLGSEIHFIDDLIDAHVHTGEMGHMFTTLKACYFQILNEKA